MALKRVSLGWALRPITDLAGNGITGASVQINVRGGSAATVYAAETGGTTATNPRTSSLGRVTGWVDQGQYTAVATFGSQTEPIDFEASAGLSALKGFVNHGATAGTARPDGYASIEWVGSVEPSNAINGDTWIDTTT